MSRKKKNIILCDVSILLIVLLLTISGYNKVNNRIDATESVVSNEEVVAEIEMQEVVEFPEVPKVEEIVIEEEIIEEPPKIVYDRVVDTVFYGDSWMDNPLFKNKFGSGNTLRVKGSKWAQYFVQNGLVTPVGNEQIVFVQFGLNDWQTGETGLTDNSYMKRFLDQLAVAHPNAKILVTRSPHTGSGYVYKLGNKDINPRCNRYSQYVKDYCDSRDNFYYVDVTSCLEDGNGWLRPEYADSSTYHLTSSGYTTWFNAIETVILEYLNM